MSDAVASDRSMVRKVKKSSYKASESKPWPTATPEEAGFCSAGLDGELAQLLGDDKTGAAALVVGGKLVWEKYWRGHSATTRFDTYSAGKAYAAAGIGVLVDQGKLGIDQWACEVIPEWAEDDRREITVRHLLTMTSGLHLDYPAFSAEADPTAATLKWPLEHKPGTVYCYEQATAQAMGIIIERLTGKQALDFVQQKILTPIGATETMWMMRGGHCTTWRSVYTSARDLCRFGQLWLQKGVWEGKRLLSENFIMQARMHDPIIEWARNDGRQADYRRRNWGWMLFANVNGIWEGVDYGCYAFLGAVGNFCLIDIRNDFVFSRLVTAEGVDPAGLENKLDVTDKGVAQLWRTVLAARTRA
jgi:CubicO group peptidase (beta-lactamase class C family)